MGAGDAVVFDILEHLLLGHAVGVGLRVEIVDEIIGPVAHFAFLAVQKRVGERGNMATGLPYPGVHQNIGVHLIAVFPFLNEALSPSVLYIVFEPCPEGAVVPGVGKAAVNIAAGENEAPGFTEVHNFFHGFFRLIHMLPAPFFKRAAYRFPEAPCGIFAKKPNEKAAEILRR